MYKAGFQQLKEKLFDPNINCDLRDEKLKVFIMGCDVNGNVVYNKGNTVRIGLNDLENMFNMVGCSHVWDSIYDEYVAKNIHLYRSSDLPNRHTHWNGKPSYWALGYKNLKSYFGEISKTEQDEYCKIHTHCCGVWDGVPVKWA